MEKYSFLTIVANVMKVMLSYESMMESLQRSMLIGEEKYLELMKNEEDRCDAFIRDAVDIKELALPQELLDVLVLRYLRNTQFLAGISEDDIDVSGIEEGDLSYWKKAMLFKPPQQVFKILDK